MFLNKYEAFQSSSSSFWDCMTFKTFNFWWRIVVEINDSKSSYLFWWVETQINNNLIPPKAQSPKLIPKSPSSQILTPNLNPISISHGRSFVTKIQTPIWDFDYYRWGGRFRLKGWKLWSFGLLNPLERQRGIWDLRRRRWWTEVTEVNIYLNNK